jgi:hypothetical protein
VKKAEKFLVVLLLLSGVVYGQKPARASCSEHDLAQKMRQSDFVIVAKVKQVFTPPGDWSGMLAAMQLVEYEPTEVLKGKLEKSSIVTSHYVVANSAIADRDEERPQLLPALFHPGREVIVLLNSGPGKFWPEASGCKTQTNKLCAMVSSDPQHVELARVSKTEPDPTYNVQDENCGVLSADEWKETVIKLLTE